MATSLDKLENKVQIHYLHVKRFHMVKTLTNKPSYSTCNKRPAIATAYAAMHPNLAHSTCLPEGYVLLAFISYFKKDSLGPNHLRIYWIDFYIFFTNW